MAHRPHFYVRKFDYVDGGESPNEYKPLVTVEVRVFYPARQVPRAAELLDEAIDEARQEMATALAKFFEDYGELTVGPGGDR